VLRSIRTQKINYLDNFWDLYAKLPTETAFYVPKFLAVLHILQDPESHGFTLPPVENEIQKEEVTVNKQVHLNTIAKNLNLSYDLLKILNPELRRYSTPDRPYTLNMPPGTGERLLAKLPGLPVWSPPVPAYAVHRVRKGETLSGIADRYRTSVRSIMAMNGLRNSHYLKVGWKLKIPTKRYYRSAGRASSGRAEPLPTGIPARYTVRKGDSLWKIANRFGTTTKSIQSVNQLKGTHLRIGQVLRIPTGSSALSDMKTKHYKVSGGDSPYLIARRHQMSLSEFLRLNNLTPRSTIYPGQVLLVKAK
jgi:membrane-bound lytic murein transglycosylase D